VNPSVSNSDDGPPLGKASRLRAIVGSLAALAFVGYLGHQLWLNRDEIQRAFALDRQTLAGITLMVLIAHLQRAFEFNFMLRRLGANEKYRDGVALTGATLLLNHIPLSAGSVARGVTLYRRYGLAYATYVSALMFATVMNGHMAADVGLALTLRSHTDSTHALALGGSFGVVALGSAALLLLPYAWAPKGDGFVARQVRRLAEGLAILRGGSGLPVLAATSATKLVLNSTRLWLCLHAVGQDASLGGVVLLGSAAVIMSLVSVVPNNIGIRELVLGALAGAIGFPPALGAVAAALERAVTFAYAVIVGLPCLYLVRRSLREAKPAVPAPAELP
jgi:uncharacterized membrane protein YbhN (UPF0104 family)